MNTNEGFKVGDRAMYVGERFGKKCNFPVVLREQNPHVPECFGVDAVMAHNVGYTPDNWVHVRDLAPMPKITKDEAAAREEADAWKSYHV